ncbi:MAG TPA: hypothetical protein PLD25_23605 [Chloroflexota bacterium]|nr:hypothetical protein [Chloroflexota bacterium]HUM67476.1 hypothetical protein [Chloroflexota bacterium]
MSVNRITIKFFIEDGAGYEITNVVPVFHRWIQTTAVPGLLIDVADYKHVADGPGIILIGHEVDYALDNSHGRAGFLTRRKRINQGTLAENLREALATAVTAAQQFTEDTGLALRRDEIEITFPDRLHAPNNEETFAQFRQETQVVLQKQYGNVELRNGAVDERRPLTIAGVIG